MVRISGEGFFDLGGEFQGEGVEALRQIANVLKEIVVGDEGGDSGEKAGGGSNQRFGDTGSNGAKAGGAGSAKSGEGIDDAPNGAEEPDERRNSSGGGKPGHAFFNAADFFGGSQLHADRDGLQALQFSGRLRIAGANLAQEFAVACGVDRGERRASGRECLGIGYALGGAKDAEELVALAANAAEEAELLKDHGPRDDGEDCKQEQYAAGDPARLSKDVTEISDKNRSEQKNDATPQLEINLPDFTNVAHAYRVVKQMRCRR